MLVACESWVSKICLEDSTKLTKISIDKNKTSMDIIFSIVHAFTFPINVYIYSLPPNKNSDFMSLQLK